MSDISNRNSGGKAPAGLPWLGSYGGPPGTPPLLPVAINGDPEHKRPIPAAVRLVTRAKELQATANSTSWELADTYAELKGLGWSYRQIAEACETNRSTVSLFVRCVTRHPRVTVRPTFWDAYRQVRPDKAGHFSRGGGHCEWYTPAGYVEAARRVLGAIDLDPASSPSAQRTVQAATYYTAGDDGLAQDWHGRCWLNPPYSARLVDEFVRKLCAHYAAGDVPAAVLLVNNCTETAWFQRVAGVAAAICFPRERIAFRDAEGTVLTPFQGQAVVYLGPAAAAFLETFSAFGFCTVFSRGAHSGAGSI